MQSIASLCVWQPRFGGFPIAPAEEAPFGRLLFGQNT